MGHRTVVVRDIGSRATTDDVIVLALPDDATAAQVVKLLESFVRCEDWLARLTGRSAIVELWHVCFRPA